MEILIAASLYAADTSATIDYGWRRGPAHTWVKPDGTVVRYADSPQKLYGLPRETVINIGWAWYEHPDSERFKDILMERFHNIVKHSDNLAKPPPQSAEGSTE